MPENGPDDAGCLQVKAESHRLSIYRPGVVEPVLVQNAEKDRRPFIHPIIAPDGDGIMTEDAPAHHPWQHGLYTGLNDVNGFGFWTEGLRDNPLDGTFHPRSIHSISVLGNQACWTVETEWREPGGNLLLVELQSWTFRDKGSTFELDLDWTVRAEQLLKLGQYNYGGLFMRMPHRTDVGAAFLNSEGITSNIEADGKRARWGAVHMMVEGRDGPGGIALMDHPDNEQYPAPWRVDKQLGLSPSPCIGGERRLSVHELRKLRYRAYVFTGPCDAARIEANWMAFADTRMENSTLQSEESNP